MHSFFVYLSLHTGRVLRDDSVDNNNERNAKKNGQEKQIQPSDGDICIGKRMLRLRPKMGVRNIPGGHRKPYSLTAHAFIAPMGAKGRTVHRLSVLHVQRGCNF